MLYDILPPLFLFASFGGIILVVSRVILRVRRQALSQHIQAQAATAPNIGEDKVFAPGKKGVKLVRNRLALTTQVLKSSATRTKEAVREKKTAAVSRFARRNEAAPAVEAEMVEQPKEATDTVGRIQMPKKSWRDRFARTAEKGKSRFSFLRRREEESPAVAASAPTPAAVRPMPKEEVAATLRLVKAMKKRTPAPAPSQQKAAVPATRTKSKLTKKVRTDMLSRIMSQDEVLSTPLREAKDALETSDYSRVEDILIPYIVQHTKDVKAYILLGQAALGRKAWDDAIEIFQQILKIDSATKGIYAALGSAALRSGKITLALQSLQRAHDEDPTNIRILKQLLVLGRRMDNKVLERSSREQLQALGALPLELAEEKTPAAAQA